MSQARITCMCVSATDEPVPLFLGRDDGTVEKYVYIQDVDLGRPSLVLHGHTEAVTVVSALSADEVYSCSLDAKIQLWNTSDEFDTTASEEWDRTQAYKSNLNSIRLSTFTTTAKTTNKTGDHVHASKIDYPPSRVLRTITLPSPIHCLAVRETRLYAGGQDGSLYVIEDGGSRISTWAGHYDRISCIACTSDNLVVTGSYDNQLRVWDEMTGRCVRLLQGHANLVKGVAVMLVPENAFGIDDANDHADVNYVDDVEQDYGDAGAADVAGVIDEIAHVVLSVSLDATLRLWVLPSQLTLQAEMERNNSEAALQARWMSGHAERPMTVSFQIDKEESGEHDDDTVAAAPAAETQHQTRAHSVAIAQTWSDEKDTASPAAATHTDSRQAREDATNAHYKLNKNNLGTERTTQDTDNTSNDSRYNDANTDNDKDRISHRAARSGAEVAARCDTPNGTTESTEASSVTTQQLQDTLRTSHANKSALKHKRAPYARRLVARASIELPHIPYSLCETSEPSSASSLFMLLYIGGSRGELSCVHSGKLMRVVLRQTQQMRRAALRAAQTAQRQLKDRVAQLRRRCAKSIGRRERAMLQCARQERQKAAVAVVRVQEKHVRQNDSPLTSKQSLSSRRSSEEKADEDKHGADEGHDEDLIELETDHDEVLVENDSISSNGIDSDSDSVPWGETMVNVDKEEYENEDHSVMRMMMSHENNSAAMTALTEEPRWQILTAEQRASLKAFVQARKEGCTKDIAEVKRSAEARVRELDALAAMTSYVRTRETFDQLPYTWRMVCGNEAVHAAVHSRAGLYVAQEGCVKRVAMKVGVTRL